ncbi:poly(A) polymerase-like protein [Trifolium pratense]|uniref:Poly(A) polymerase-like protein n=1 Tax=Trifolium pratense TaxID=57577 RepID=A0A2K3NV59_TRIPR|nr:poly(A) polymerase-like protein [Trifolium pratense]
MAISTFKLVCKPNLHLRTIPFQCVHKVVPKSVPSVHPEECSRSLILKQVNNKKTLWKKFNSEELGFRDYMIASPINKVLNKLKKKGYDVYLVGGCVRDLILMQTPKDFDIITSADLREVKRTFDWCEIVGRRFPICHVHMDGIIVEVSSFKTYRWKPGRHFSHDVEFEAPKGCDKEDYLRWRNCSKRDFTINGFMFDPFAKIVYDYMGGMKDIIKAKVRTMVPAATSFQEDYARILRGIRIAARLGFSISTETARSIKALSYSVLRLDKGRLLMEMNYMLAYGSGEASLRLLWKYGLLDILLPFQALYFVRRGFRRRDKRTNMLLSFFFNLDKLLAPDRPCHSSLWVGILALHKSLSDQPRNPLVIAAFSLAVYNGGNLLEAADIARRINQPHDIRFPELSDPCDLNAKALENEILDLAESVKVSLLQMTSRHSVARAMADYPKAPYSDMVFIPLPMYLKVLGIFDCLKVSACKRLLSKEGREIDYESLARGDLREMRRLFARVVFETVYPLDFQDSTTAV